MNTALRSLLGCALLLLATPALADGSSPPSGKTDGITEEFIRKLRWRCPPGFCCPPMYEHSVEPRCSSSHSNSPRDQAPAWMLSRMPILVPDGTPQTVYRAPGVRP